jgi:hypothetical protein
MSTLHDRLLEIATAIGNDAELARIANVSRSNVRQWRTGDVKTLKALSALNIQERAGYSARWLVLGLGPKKLTGKSDLPESSALPYTTQKLSPANEKNLLVVLRSFLNTDDEGKAQIVEAVKAVTGANGSTSGQPAKHQSSKRRRGSVNH